MQRVTPTLMNSRAASRREEQLELVPEMQERQGTTCYTGDGHFAERPPDAFCSCFHDCRHGLLRPDACVRWSPSRKAIWCAVHMHEHKGRPLGDCSRPFNRQLHHGYSLHNRATESAAPNLFRQRNEPERCRSRITRVARRA